MSVSGPGPGAAAGAGETGSATSAIDRMRFFRHILIIQVTGSLAGHCGGARAKLWRIGGDCGAGAGPFARDRANGIGTDLTIGPLAGPGASPVTVTTPIPQY